MCWETSATFPCDRSAPTRTRHFVVAQLCELPPPGAAIPAAWERMIDDAELIASELTTNALRAECAALALSLDGHQGELTLRLHDDAAGWPAPQSPQESDPSGRGLRLVQALATRWGAEADNKLGKQVWATLDVPEPCGAWFNCAS